MKRIKFSEYYSLSNHFIVFDGYMSHKKHKKSEVIKDIGENFPKYSRCKNNETKPETIRNVYCKMCNKLNMKYVTENDKCVPTGLIF